MIVLNCIRYLGMTDINEIGRLTLYEYDLLMTGKALAAVDESHKAHKQAWINYQVTATKLVGGKKNKKEVPVYKKFKDFFDYEEEIRKITQEIDEGYDKKGMDLLLKANL
ncbi:hypothetical protein [Streptococcus pyogenes]|uniref:hypothetical protein n=1 Tax=Streptococcus pyogenes TaxID=1314 RepID=UPI00000D997F|nr:hypothetical protein [Streptococcus pyogenes]HER4552868.1 hypothetical protein [Streptococcus pyogenes NGAS664]HER4721207.1 hypothetical protein [Streptococcus pyogenes NGAS308]HER4769131.1 hypothetical protein [Streptococcus pyogenes NGAS209]HER4799443.1 hypothetical protein [Streptococcus pyogenes NGAS113]AAL97865.1 conserved hypothetical phage protein [Streptococcus pyogenes MGAS8232]